MARAAEPTDITSLEGFAISAEELRARHPQSLRVSAPGHLLVPAKAKRPHNANWHAHQWGRPVPPGAIFHLWRDVYIMSPEFCFFQLARELSPFDTIKLGMELCGDYSTLIPPGTTGFLDRPALTDAAALRAFVESVSRVKGNTHATRAMVHVADGSASPMETASKMLLCLPYRFGCPGFPAPRMNHRIDLTPEERRQTGKTHLRCDLYWERKGRKVAGEYKGRGSHTAQPDLDNDAIRESVLRSRGVTVVPIAYASLSTPEGFGALTRNLEKLLDKPVRPHQGDYLALQAETRAAVLRGNGSWLH